MFMRSDTREPLEIKRVAFRDGEEYRAGSQVAFSHLKLRYRAVLLIIIIIIMIIMMIIMIIIIIMMII